MKKSNVVAEQDSIEEKKENDDIDILSLRTTLGSMSSGKSSSLAIFYFASIN